MENQLFLNKNMQVNKKKLFLNDSYMREYNRMPIDEDC